VLREWVLNQGIQPIAGEKNAPAMLATSERMTKADVDG
jgi:hypothetical protein